MFLSFTADVRCGAFSTIDSIGVCIPFDKVRRHMKATGAFVNVADHSGRS